MICGVPSLIMVIKEIGQGRFQIYLWCQARQLSSTFPIHHPRSSRLIDLLNQVWATASPIVLLATFYMRRRQAKRSTQGMKEHHSPSSWILSRPATLLPSSSPTKTYRIPVSFSATRSKLFGIKVHTGCTSTPHQAGGGQDHCHHVLPKCRLFTRPRRRQQHA